MPACHEMNANETYTCTSCELEVLVKQACSCEPTCSECPPKEFSCCDKPLVKKAS